MSDVVKVIAFEQSPRASRLNLTAFAAWHATFLHKATGKVTPTTLVTLVSRIHKLPLHLIYCVHNRHQEMAPELYAGGEREALQKFVISLLLHMLLLPL